MATLDDLPEEILAQIASYLDTEPLSTTRLRYEPHPEGFRQKERPLLHLSSCSQQMRRVVLPTLFRHTRLNFTYPFQRIQISLIERQLCEFERRMQGLDFYGGDVKPDLDEYFVDSILEQIVGSRTILICPLTSDQSLAGQVLGFCGKGKTGSEQSPDRSP